MFFEGIAGEGGIRAISDEMIACIKQLKDKYGFLVVADEIQTGIGLTGKFLNYEHTELIPDAIASAKGLGGGLPLGAFLVSSKLAEIFNIGEHGTTFGGNPLACATGLATVSEVGKSSFLKNVFENGNYFKAKLNSLASNFPSIIKDVRGRGLMLGMEVKHSGPEIVKLALENKVILNVTAAGTVLRFVPPLIIEKDEIDIAINVINNVLRNLN